MVMKKYENVHNTVGNKTIDKRKNSCIILHKIEKLNAKINSLSTSHQKNS